MHFDIGVDINVFCGLDVAWALKHEIGITLPDTSERKYPVGCVRFEIGAFNRNRSTMLIGQPWKSLSEK